MEEKNIEKNIDKRRIGIRLLSGAQLKYIAFISMLIANKNTK